MAETRNVGENSNQLFEADLSSMIGYKSFGCRRTFAPFLAAVAILIKGIKNCNKIKWKLDQICFVTSSFDLQIYSSKKNFARYCQQGSKFPNLPPTNNILSFIFSFANENCHLITIDACMHAVVRYYQNICYIDFIVNWYDWYWYFLPPCQN